MDYFSSGHCGPHHKSISILPGVFLLLCSLFAGAQPADNAGVQTPEEIVVNPTESFPILRRQIIEAEENLFSIYNELNEDDEFDVICTYENRPGSRLREHVCRPAYFWIARNGEAMRMYGAVGATFDPTKGGGGAYSPNISTDPGSSAGRGRGLGVEILGRYNRDMEDKIIAVIQKSPEFVEAVSEYNVLSEQYQTIREERFGD